MPSETILQDVSDIQEELTAEDLAAHDEASRKARAEEDHKQTQPEAGSSEQTGQEAEGQQVAPEESEQTPQLKQEDFNSLRSTYDKKLAQKEKELETFKRIAYKTAGEAIEYNHDGPVVDWNRIQPFQQPVQNQPPPVIPQPPTADELELEPEKAREKQNAYFEWRIQEATNKMWEQKEAENRKRETEYAFQRMKEEAIKKTSELYPDYLNRESELFKEGANVVRENPALLELPNADLVITQMAAARLGIPSTALKAKQQKDTSTIITGGPSKGTTPKPKTSLTDEEFMKLTDEEERAYIRKAMTGA